MKCVVRIENGIAYPNTDESANWMMDSSDRCYAVDFKPARSPQYHRYAMKMLRIMFDMVDESIGFEPWRKMLAVKAGYFTSVGKVDVKGTTSVAVIPDSLSFENMDEDEFKQCWNDMHQAFVNKYHKSLTQAQLCEWSAM